MKAILLSIAICVFMSKAFAQTESPKEIQAITVPDFADPGVKTFYQSYADHLIKCVKAIREKNEAKTIALFKDPGEQLVTKEKALAKELVKNPAEKQKYMQFATQAYPLLKEVQQSGYYKKLYGQ
ncbi:MAG: hypothetical protein JJE22_10380 [Bacteroidia bacterium]|nr:hypothetical protein [Bacteroidia bacterium]